MLHNFVCGRVLPWFGFNVKMSILVCIRQILSALGSDTVCHRWVGTSLWHGISYHYRYIWDHTGIYYVIMMFQTLGWWRSGVGMKMWIYIGKLSRYLWLIMFLYIMVRKQNYPQRPDLWIYSCKSSRWHSNNSVMLSGGDHDHQKSVIWHNIATMDLGCYNCHEGYSHHVFTIFSHM